MLVFGAYRVFQHVKQKRHFYNLVNDDDFNQVPAGHPDREKEGGEGASRSQCRWALTGHRVGACAVHL